MNQTVTLKYKGDDSTSNSLRYIWWLMELSFWFQAGFCWIFWAFSQCQTQKIILHKVKLNPSEVRLNTKKLEKLWKLIFWTFMLFWVFWVEKVYVRWHSTHVRWDLMSHQSDYSLLHILHGCLRIFTSVTHSVLFHYRFSLLVPPMPSPQRRLVQQNMSRIPFWRKHRQNK